VSAGWKNERGERGLFLVSGEDAVRPWGRAFRPSSADLLRGCSRTRRAPLMMPPARPGQCFRTCSESVLRSIFLIILRNTNTNTKFRARRQCVLLEAKVMK
jgi:hypothetical protein